MQWTFKTTAPSLSEIFFLKAVIVAGSSQWPLKTTVLYQSKLFFLKAVIVAWSYAVAFQDHSTLPN